MPIIKKYEPKRGKTKSNIDYNSRKNLRTLQKLVSKYSTDFNDLTVKELQPIVKRIRTLVNKQIKAIKDLHSDLGYYYGEDFLPLKNGFKVTKDIASNKGKLTNLFKIAKNFAYSDFTDIDILKSIRADILNRIGGKFGTVEEERHFWDALKIVNKYAIDIKELYGYSNFVAYFRELVANPEFDLEKFEKDLQDEEKKDEFYLNVKNATTNGFVSNKKGDEENNGGFFQ